MSYIARNFIIQSNRKKIIQKFDSINVLIKNHLFLFIIYNMAEEWDHKLVRRSTIFNIVEYAKTSLKTKIEFSGETIMVVAPYLWVKQSKKQEKKGATIMVSKPVKLMQDRSQYISDTINISTVLNETASMLKMITNSNGVLLYMVNISNDELILSSGGRQKISWSISRGTTAACYVARTKECVILNDPIGELDFDGFDWKGFSVTAVLCVPIITSDNQCFAVIELYRRNNIHYTMKDLDIVVTVNKWMGLSINLNNQRILLQTQIELNNYLLELTQHYFSNVDHLDDLIEDLVNFTKDTLDSERGSFFVLNKETDELIAEAFDHDHSIKSKKNKFRINKERGIAGFVLRSGKIINVEDAYVDPRFDRESDLRTGFITRSILCSPVVGRNGILGALQVINKHTGIYTKYDEILFQIFADYCAIGLEHTYLQKENLRNQTIGDVYKEVFAVQLSRQIKQPEDIIQINLNEIPYHINDFAYYPDKEADLIKLSFFLFNPLGFDTVDISKFIYSVRRGYRLNPYHNFLHAFNALHSIHCMVHKNLKLFSKNEKIAFYIAAICHDIDHRGLTNSYLQLIDSPFMALYDSSLMENHHFFLTLLTLEESNIGKKFSATDFKIITEYIKEMILATDLTRHLRERPITQKLCDRIQSDINLIGNTISINFDDENQRLLRNLMMTSADLSGQAKPFSIAKDIVKNVMTEFFAESKLIENIGQTPLPSMDIKYMDKIPENQIQFLDIIAIPCYRLLKTLLPNTKEMLDLCTNLRSCWLELINYRKEKNQKTN